MSNTIAIVPAAGRGVRMGADRPKQFLELSGKSILAHTLDALADLPFLGGALLVVPEGFMEEAADLARRCARPERFPISVVAGGAERQDSVFNGLSSLPEDCEWVFIHDGVRPFASPKLMEETWREARRAGACIAALPATDTIKRVEDGRVLQTLRREEIWLVQTPQVFRKDILTNAYLEARRGGWTGTDDASFVERCGIPVSVVRGERVNIKVTTPEDLEWAAWFLSRSARRGAEENRGVCP